MDKKEYIKFMCNPSNEHRCENCPENRGWFPQAELPCGQQTCWVTCHCREEAED